ncbi:bromodomain adjacent to zinc finger domain protein 2B-like isoform X3 [Sitophilus oryzae]|uniref:Bromodomain adjacent to zinc finger domain protein 2B-like isoform X3 n=1 Tax=Sitophilus oryzae TaxID=7048 RepID=A0A6J2YNQ0_SITOR|nr:bromodomain adjacent to zinc finger domain protein 2B-like isoform X3 [Sitophilus oryzae]
MDKENGKGNDSSSGPSKVSSVQDPAAILDAASLFGAYWPRSDASTANLFAAASGFGLPPHAAAALPFGLLPAAAAAQGGRGGSSSSTSGGGTNLPPSYPASSTAAPSGAAAAAAAAYSNAAYSSTLSVAASQAASLGMPVASAAWWSMASHLAAQDYLARLQASGLNFPMGGPADPYAALGLPSLTGGGHHKSKSPSKSSRSSSNNKDKMAAAAAAASMGSSGSMKMDHHKLNSSISMSKTSSNNSLKYSSPSGLTIQPSVKLPGTNSSVSDSKSRKHSSDLSYLTKLDVKQKTSSASVSTPPAPITSSSTISSVTTTSCVKPPADSPSIYSNPMSLASNQDKGAMSILNSNSSHNSVVNSSSSGLPSSILSAALEGSRLPPDTEIIKYTSSIVGPKIPGTTNRGRKKTISLDPPSVSVLPSHSSTGLSIERTLKRARLSDDDTPGGTSMSDRVEVIKLPATNGSPSGISSFNSSDGSGEAPLNLSLKPNYTTSGSTSSLNSLSNMSANIGSDRISRRKPGPKPRRVIPMESTPPPPSSTPNTILNQYFSGIDSPRPPSRNEGSDGGSSTSSTSAAPSGPSGTGGISIMNHKEGRPRNLGRGVSKPKKNTVASLLAQSRALGIKPVPMLDPNASMNQQMNLLKSNILAAQQYISEAGGDEKALNKFLQERFKGTLSDSSTVDASDSDNLTDSNHTDSEIETEIVAKKQKQYDERLLRVPLERGWKRETVIRGVTKNGGIRGDVSYAAPDSSNKFKQMSDITQYLEYQKSTELTKDNFTFSCRVIIGDYLQPVPPEMQTDGNEYIYLTEEDVTKRLEELRAAMRTSLPVEQRIEMAKKQQAARAAARLDREQQRLTKELERNERQEAARREREARSQQLLEAKRKRQEELEKQKQEEQHRKQQERELKRQQAAMLKEQIYIQEINKQREMLYTVELEKERRRQHLALIKAMESRRKLEEKEKRKQQLLAEKQANKEKKLEQRRVDLEILTELRKPCEDLELNQKPLPTYERIHGLKLSGKAFADTLMIFEFLHNFGETLGFDMDSLPTLDSIQQALVPNDHSYEAEEELFSVITHLLVCAIEDPGIPNPARHTTILGQSLRQADITHVNLSEILRIYLYANATGEVKALTGVHFERDREKRIADHHQTEDEMQQTVAGKNSHYYELLHENPTYKMSDLLKDKPFIALSPTDKAAILAFICNELLQNKAVTRQIENSLENMIQHKKEKWLLDQKIRKLKVVHSKKLRTEALEKSHNKSEMEEGALDSPHLLHKDDLLEDEEHEMSDNESVGTQPEEEEDAKLSGEELAKKLEKLSQTSENHLQTINTSMSQLRAVTFGEDRYFRRYWSLPRSGGIFVEAMESAEPEEFEEQSKNDQVENLSNGIRNLNELHSVIEKVEKIDDHADDKEVSSIVGGSDTDKESNIAIIKPQTNNNESEHRKTPNRLENGEITETHNLAELNKSVENIVQSLEERIEACKEEKLTESQLQSDINDAKNLDDSDSISNRKFNLFERLGQCMERENRTEEDLKAEVKAEVKEELKNEILKELKQEIKSEIKTELEENDEFKWFSILHKDGSTCDEVHLTAGNKWDNGNVGACTKDITELKIPVFPPPCSNSGMNLHHNCESPAPLQMTSEESVQLELIRKHGMPSSFEKKPVPFDQRYGWWRIKTLEQLREVLENLHVRGVRERELKRSFVINMQQMYNKGKLVIEEGCDELTKLSGENIENINFVVGDIPMPDVPGSWSKVIAHRVDMFLLEQVEALEDKVASASMQVKGWKIPERDTDDIPYGEVVNIIKNKLSSLEINIERRYLKPPLGVNTNIRSSTGSSQDSSFQSTTVESATSTPVISQQVPPPDDIPKGLGVWREAVNRASTSAQLAMCLYSLESSIAWDKSIMKAVSEPAEFSIQNARKYNSKLSNCQFCHSGDNEDKLLLCDSCDRGYHTYCFKPKMENIPEGDWYCHECMNKATGDRNCIVCGRKMSTTGTRLLVCELCPRAYHTDCIQPQIHKVPRGKWYCTNCFSKKPQKKPVKKNHTKPTKENESAPEQPPASPAPSHSSVTTNDDVPTTNCSQNSDVSNSSLTSGLINAGSPSTCAKKEKEKANKKLMKELTPCRLILEDLECHDDAWPFLLPVNTKQFPTYKKIIKIPMDLSTIKKRLQDLVYKSREEFCSDVRQIFNNCETFNEDDSPVGKAGHCMRQFFESRWNELCASHS